MLKVTDAKLLNGSVNIEIQTEYCQMPEKVYFL